MRAEYARTTFRHTRFLLDGVKDGFLINPTVVDARTGITTQLLSEEGFTVDLALNPNAEEEASYGETDFERKFFAEAANMLFCKTLLENALRDPISGEIGKSIVFAVSQNHAAKLVQILNQMADRIFPGRYHSDFAVQVTSLVDDAQQMAVNFANNNLLGNGSFVPAYKTSKARVCVTVGMMTTGYDCPDILNLALKRPIFSPTDFIQMKGRGTRGHNFTDEVRDDTLRSQYGPQEKTAYKLFDFFATCEYFEGGGSTTTRSFRCLCLPEALASPSRVRSQSQAPLCLTAHTSTPAMTFSPRCKCRPLARRGCALTASSSFALKTLCARTPSSPPRSTRASGSRPRTTSAARSWTSPRSSSPWKSYGVPPPPTAA